MISNFEDSEPLSSFCPRCRERVSRYVNNERKLLFTIGLFRVHCPKCKDDITEGCKENFNESIVTLLAKSYTGWFLLFAFFAVGLVLISVITNKT